MLQALAVSLERPAVALLLRIALVSAFLASGVLKALDFDGATGEVRALSGLEPAALFAVLVIAGGRAAWIGAILLAGFTVVATIVAHDFWSKAGVARVRDLTTFFEHAGLCAGLLAVGALEARRHGMARP